MTLFFKKFVLFDKCLQNVELASKKHHFIQYSIKTWQIWKHDPTPCKHKLNVYQNVITKHHYIQHKTILVKFQLEYMLIKTLTK